MTKCTVATQETFGDWPLHDAVLGPITVDLERCTCRLELLVFFSLQERARPAVVEWRDVSSFAVTHESPWGTSQAVRILEQRRLDSRRYEIVLQSGDLVSVSAGGASLRELAPQSGS